MQSKVLPFLVSALLLSSASAFAVDFDEFDDSSESTSSSGSGNETYDGSTASEFAGDEDYAAEYAQYRKEKTSKAEINRQRTEGFARAILLGVRGSAGINTFFGGETEGWTIGYQGAAGLMVQMPLGVKNLSMVPELVFNYRHYKYAIDTDFGDNDASLDIMLFEIPLIVRSTFVDYNIFVGLGLNLGLALTSSSEFNQNMDSGDDTRRDNTIKTNSFEIGGTADFGYMLTRWVHLNLRVTQGFTNLLNATINAERTFENSNFLTFYVTAGASFMF